MTVPLSPESPRRKAALRFGTLLTATMAARGVGKNSLARQLGLGNSIIWNWAAGNNLPRLETALRLSEALAEPRLAAIVREARTIACETCGTAVVNEGGSPIRFCSESCKVVRNAMRSGTPTRERAVVAERRLRLHQASVAEFCRGCQPEGLCRDAECALRPVSPLRLAKRPDDAPMVDADPPRTLSEQHRARIGESARRRWDRPGERERSSAAISAHLRARTPEEVDRWKRNIGQAQRRRLGTA